MSCCNNDCHRRRRRCFRPVEVEVVTPVVNRREVFVPIDLPFNDDDDDRRPRNSTRRGEQFLKAATIGSFNLDAGHAIPFAFNAIDEGVDIKHFPGDTNFSIRRTAFDEVSYKLNFVPLQSGTATFVLNVNGTPLSDSEITISANAGEKHFVSLTDLFLLYEGNVLDLMFSPLSTIDTITITDPVLIVRRIGDGRND